MPYNDEKYRERRKQACRELFENFEPDVSRSRNPKEVLLIRDKLAEGYFSHEIAPLIGKTPKAVQKTMRRYDFPVMHNFCVPEMEERPDFLTGEQIDKHGYVSRRVKGHPHATKYGNYVRVHRLVMEEKLGRYLTPEEVVDHIDGNPSNNHPDNLRVFPNNAEHLRQTLKGRCPKWSEEGKARLRKVWENRKRNNQGQFADGEALSSHLESKTDVGQSQQ